MFYVFVRAVDFSGMHKTKTGRSITGITPEKKTANRAETKMYNVQMSSGNAEEKMYNVHLFPVYF
jgi:hypothetical protein